MHLKGTFLCLSLLLASSLSISSYLNEQDQIRLKDILLRSLNNDDVGILAHAARGLALSGTPIPQKDKLCQKLATKLTEQTPEALFHVSKACLALGCSLSPPVGMKEKLETGITSSVTVPELFFITGALSAFGLGLDSPTVIKMLNLALKKDDSISSLGQAFHIASLLQGDVDSIFSRIEDAIVQADQVDGKILQFEGGLSVTALVVSGAYQLAKTAGKVPPISKDQANKFAEYFVGRKSVQTVKGAHSLLEIAAIFADNDFHLPVAITLASRAAVSKNDPKFQVKVTDILGKSLKSLTVIADSATRTLDDAVILSQKQLMSRDGIFELDMMSSNPSKGVYRVALSASSTQGQEARLVGNLGSVVEVKVLAKLAIEDVELGAADSDQSTAVKLKRINYPQKQSGILEADSHQRLILKFLLRDPQSKELITVHQAFVRLTHGETQQEIFFVAEPDVNDVYKFDLDLAAKAKDFLYLSGLYSMDLIIGDAVIENPTVWQLADLQLTFTSSGTGSIKSATTVQMYNSKPEIKHMFREAEKRPPAIVSNLFTFLVILPFIMFIGLTMKLGINLSTISLSLTAMGFHLSMGAVFGLFICFYLYLNMFQTIKWLVILALPAFISGNFMLTQIATKRKQTSK